ncbi:MAG TPA: hypothetical protein VGF63_03735 [Solirubrobacteraceae bacterium]|jgi:hypothetical protein
MRTLARHPLVVALLATLAATTAAAPAVAASSWTKPQAFPVGRNYEPVPRAAIASDGTSAVAYESKSGKLMLSTGRANGTFTAPKPIDQKGALDWSVAARPGGGFVVVWEDGDGIRVAVRARSGAKTVVRRAVASNGEEIDGVQVAADPLGGWVVAERQFRKGEGDHYWVRAFSLTTAGKLTGAVQDLGPGQFGIDARPTQALAVDAHGRAVLAYRQEIQTKGSLAYPILVTTRPHGGAFAAPVQLGAADAADPRVAVGSGGRALIAATQVVSSGDAGEFGSPVVARVGPAGALGTPFGPAISNPARAFAPSAALTSQGRAVLVYQQKQSSQPFETRAPVFAVAIAAGGTVGPIQTLTTGLAKEPVVMALSGGRALTVWSGAKGIGASLAGPDGAFEKTAEPKGPPPPAFHTNSTNRDLRTGGRWAIFTWEANGRVYSAVRGF